MACRFSRRNRLEIVANRLVSHRPGGLLDCLHSTLELHFVVTGRSSHWPVGRANAESVVRGVRAPKVERFGLPGQIHHVVKHRWVDPCCLGRRDAVTHVFLVIALGSRELSGCEAQWLSEEVRVLGELRHHLANEPLLVVATSTRNFISRDFHQFFAVSGGNKVSGWEDFDVNDGQDAVVNVVVVNFASDDFFADMMDLWHDGFVDNSLLKSVSQTIVRIDSRHTWGPSLGHICVNRVPKIHNAFKHRCRGSILDNVVVVLGKKLSEGRILAQSGLLWRSWQRLVHAES